MSRLGRHFSALHGYGKFKADPGTAENLYNKKPPISAPKRMITIHSTPPTPINIIYIDCCSFSAGAVSWVYVLREFCCWSKDATLRLQPCDCLVQAHRRHHGGGPELSSQISTKECAYAYELYIIYFGACMYASAFVQ